MNQGKMILWMAVPGLLLAAFGVAVYKYYKLKKYANRTMELVDDTLEQLIAGREVIHFQKNEDSLLGKFQTQMGRLYDIQKAHERREKELREQMSRSISDLVHQINTPIANIKMYSEFLKEEGLTPEEYVHFADNLEKQAQKLGWLGEGFSRISRLETGIISLKPKVQPVLPPLLQAIDQVSLKAEKHGNDLQMRETRIWRHGWTESGRRKCFLICWIMRSNTVIPTVRFWWKFWNMRCMCGLQCAAREEK